MSNQFMYNLIILDESASMFSIKNATISGFNEIVDTTREAEVKFPEQKHYICLVSFNGEGIKKLLWNEPVAKLQKLQENQYNPSSMTPLHDAIGTSALDLEKLLPTDDSAKVLVTILTDGLENHSSEFSGEQIRMLIERLKEKAWTFTYIGANHDAIEAAQKLAISNSMQFDANNEGVDKMFQKEKMSRMAYYDKMDRAKYNPSEDYNKGYFDDTEENKA